MYCLSNVASIYKPEEDMPPMRRRQSIMTINVSHEEKEPLSSNDFYLLNMKRQNRYALPETIVDKLNAFHPHKQEIVYLLTVLNQIRALCQKLKPTIESCTKLQQTMIELNKLCDKHVDELWKSSSDIDLHKSIVNILESLISAKSTLEDALKVKFLRNSLFNEPLHAINVDIGKKSAALEMALCASTNNVLNYSHLSRSTEITRSKLGELQCISGHRLYFGHGTKQNYQLAFECYSNSAELNNSDGMNHVAMMYEKGIACIKNIEKAIKYYQSSMELHNMDATFNLANLYYLHPIYNDIPAAIELYKKAAENGHLESQTALAGLYADGVTDYLQQNVQLSIEWYRKAANEGHLEAKHNLSVVLLKNADFKSKEFVQSITILIESANEGHAASQNNLGHCYEFGKGLEMDAMKALQWYQKSAAQEYVASYVNVGYLQMKRGRYQAAFQSFSKAAKYEDNIQSWYYLGLMHEKGFFVPMNTHLAFEYFAKASKKGHELSLNKVANCFFCGSGGCQQNYSKAFDIYRKLALDGNDVAANHLAIMYEEGFGVKVDLDAAGIWYKMSADKGNEDAQRNMERLNQQMENRSITKE